jgi:hypothetical protein
MGTAAYAMPIFCSLQIECVELNVVWPGGRDRELAWIRIECYGEIGWRYPALELKTVFFRVGEIQLTVAAFVF